MSTVAIQYDPLDPATIDDPYPVLAHLREADPVHWHEAMQSWVLTRYEDCVAVLRDHDLFARDRRRLGTAVPETSLSVQSLDPPQQANIRSLFMNALWAQDLASIEHHAQRFLMARFAHLSARGEFDVMAHVAIPLSVSVVADLLGVAKPDIDSFAAISDTIMRSMDAGIDPGTAEPGRIARQELNLLVESWFQGSTRAGVLAYVMSHVDQADDEVALYVRNTARVMFQGGYSTMNAAIGNLVHTLLQNPGTLNQMRDPSPLRTGVDELVRYDGPVQGTSRIATRPTTIGGRAIRRGDTVLTHFAAANRDPRQFHQPDRLVIDRSPNRHLGFGWGTHSCIGTVPAQLTLNAVVAALLSHPEPLRPAGRPQRRRTATMRGFERLPAIFST